MTTIANYIKNIPELSAEYAELAAELNRGAEKAAANRELYATARDVVLAHMSHEPMLLADIMEACGDELPEGFSKSKVQYGLTNYWTDAIVKIDNGKSPNTYRLA